MRNFLAVVPLALLAAMLGAPLDAQEIRGRLLDGESGAPVTGAAITLMQGEGEELGRTLTDAAGGFRLAVPGAGYYRMRVTRIGYGAIVTDSVEVGPRETLEVELRALASAVPLEGVEVTAAPAAPERSRRLERMGFYNRERMGFGHFMTREQIERRSPPETVELFRQHPGFRIVPNGAGRGSEVLSTRSTGGCRPDIYLDGLLLGRDGREDPLTYIQWTDIEGIESYSSALTIPIQYKRQGRACAAILVWTR